MFHVRVIFNASSRGKLSVLVVVWLNPEHDARCVRSFSSLSDHRYLCTVFMHYIGTQSALITRIVEAVP
jgi:hypothetical protein